MKLILGLLFISQILFVSSGFASEPDIRVLLRKNRTRVHLKGTDVNFMFPAAVRELPNLEKESFHITTYISKDVRVWKVRNLRTKKVQRFSGVSLNIFGSDLQLNTRLVPDNLVLFAKDKRKFDVVTVLPLETYLAGVVPSETPASWPIETLKAQAIAARSYAMSVIKERQGSYYHVESTIFDQVYDYQNIQTFSDRLKRRVAKVLNDTKGVYLSKNKKRVYRSFYHADCGGHTEEPYLVWGDTRVVNGTVADVNCPNSPHGNWEEKIPVSDLSNKLKKFFELPDESLFQGLRITQRSNSGRALLLSADFARGEFLLSAQNLRELMGFRKIKSTKFKLSWKNKWMIVAGRGFGHGVGLCQWGAKHMGSKGKTYKEILSHYYPKAQLVKSKVVEPPEVTKASVKL